MKMMGLRTSIYWLSWFMKNLIYLTLVLIIYVIIFNINIGGKGKVINYAHPTVFFVFLLLYILATISFSFMISTFLNKGKTGLYIFLTLSMSFLAFIVDCRGYTSTI